MVSKGIGSTVAIIAGDITEYRQNLKSLNIDELLYFLKEDRCFKKLTHKKSDIFVLDDSSIISRPHGLGRIDYISDRINLSFTTDAEVLLNCYKAYYGDKAYDTPYINIKNAITEFPNFKPELIKCVKKDDSTLVFTVTASFMKFTLGDVDGKYDTIIDVYKEYFIQEYSMRERRYSKCFYIDDRGAKELGYSIGSDVFFVDGKYVLAAGSSDKLTSPKYLAEFIPSVAFDRIVFRQFYKVNLPENYIKYNIQGDFIQPLFGRHLVVMIFGNVVHDFISGAVYKIPLADKEYKSLENIKERLANRDRSDYYFRIMDIRDAGPEIELLYKSVGDELVYLKFSKIDPRIKTSQVVVRNISKQGINNIAFFKDKDYVCYFDKERGCVVILRV
jgi:hypothetical protein